MALPRQLLCNSAMACLNAPACEIGVVASAHEATTQECLRPLRPRRMRRRCNLDKRAASGVCLPLLTVGLDMRWRSALVQCRDRTGLLGQVSWLGTFPSLSGS